MITKSFFHLKSLRIGLGSFSVREYTFVQKRNECNNLEVRRLVRTCVDGSVGEVPGDDCFIQTAVESSIPPLRISSASSSQIQFLLLLVPLGRMVSFTFPERQHRLWVPPAEPLTSQRSSFNPSPSCSLASFD